MDNYRFKTGEDILELCQKYSLSIGELAIKREAQSSQISEELVYDQMVTSYQVMKESATRGVVTSKDSMGKLIGHNGKKMFDYSKGETLTSSFVSKAVAYALAVTEENARMGKIVACPTAGACGVMPSILVALSEEKNIDEDKIIKGLFTGSAVGLIIATYASVSGAEGGCQAEVGSASAMAAAALVEIMGGSPSQSLNAAAMAIKNMLGLVCDPVAGLVEVPCSKRNAGGVGNAVVAAEMALAGITSFIPFDEVVIAMGKVGRSIPSALRETAEGGLAVTQTAKDYLESR
jgi:L-serine dehydratase